MIKVNDSEFEKIMSEAIDKIPEKYFSRIKNLVFVFENDPTNEQRQKLHLHQGMTLFGLYEGIPLTKRGAGYNLVIPDKITLFKGPIERSSNNIEELKEQVRHTLWHEVAHYFGLDHNRISELE